MQTGTLSRGIAVVEAAAGNDRKIERPEVRRAHDLVVGRRTLALVHRRVAHDLEEGLAGVRKGPAAACSPTPRCATPGSGHDLLLDGVEELQQRCSGRIARPQRVDHHRQHALGTIAAIDVLHRQERAQQQAGAEEQQHRGRDLADDEHSLGFSRRARSPSGCRRRSPAPARTRWPATPERGRTAARREARPRAQNATTRMSNVSVTAAGQQPLRNHRRRDVQNRRADPHSQRRPRWSRAPGFRSGAGG